MAAQNRARTPIPSALLLLMLGLLLSGCASSGPQVAGDYSARTRGSIRYQINAYQVKGVWYYPKADYSYDETGIGSWYGEQFQGRPTSDGEIFDLNQVSAAHKTLPLPSVVEVTNLQNGRSIRLRVNDRGPFVDGRIIDLSRRAAQLLGYESAGTAQVRVRILKEESIQVANEALRGQPARTMVAQAATASPTAPVVARPQPAPVQVAQAYQPQPVYAQPAYSQPAYSQPAAYSQQQPASAAAPIVIASTPRPNPPETPVRVAEAVPAYETMPPRISPHPMPEPAQYDDEPRVAAQPQRVAAETPHRRWPSLISQAHADTLRAPLVAPPAPAQKPVLAVARGSSRIYVQAGAFAVPENAQRMRARVASLGSSVEVLPTSSSHGAPLYRVRLGPVSSEAEAARLMSRLADSGYPGARLVGE